MDSIAVLDFGCQHTHEISEAVRRAGVFSEILPYNVPLSGLEKYNGIILSGSPDSVYDKKARRCDPGIFSGGKPILGICYGHQLMAHMLGGKVKPGKGEYGRGRLRILEPDELLKGIDEGEVVWMSHGDSVLEPAVGFKVLAVSDNDKIAAVGNPEKVFYGLQFHPEVSDTPRGDKIIGNYVLRICGCKKEWVMENYIEMSIRKIREQVGEGRAISLTSGGVDSSVSGILMKMAIGDRVEYIHIDNGFQRKDEAKKVRELLGRAGIKVEVIDGSDYVLKRIGKTLDPEKKRKIIGDAFLEVLFSGREDIIRDRGLYIAQGTIYPDFVESGMGVTGGADTIKSHHNVAAKKVKRLREEGRLVEPNLMLFKSETKKVGRELGLPEEIFNRHPFPGPGLAIRYVGRVMKPWGYRRSVKKAAEILYECDLDGCVIPIGTVGVKGSARAYGNVGLIYGDRERYDDAREAASRLGNEIRTITRAVFHLDGEKHSQREWNRIKKMYITRDGLETLRTVDDIAMENLEKYGIYHNIGQMPVILFSGPEKPWVAFRQVVTDRYMTARPPDIPGEIPWDYFDETIDMIKSNREIQARGGVGGFVLDLMNKPPGTIEWE